MYTVARAFWTFALDALPSSIIIHAAKVSWALTDNFTEQGWNLMLRHYAWTEGLLANREANYDGLLAASAALDTLMIAGSGAPTSTTLETNVNIPWVQGAADAGEPVKLCALSNRDIAGNAPSTNPALNGEIFTFAGPNNGNAAFIPTLHLDYEIDKSAWWGF